MRLKVVGSGIVALTTAAVFAEVGHDVSLYFHGQHGEAASEKLTHQVMYKSTTGAAAAFWTPFAVGDYKRIWALRSLVRFAEQSNPSKVQSVNGVFWGRLNVYGQSHDELLNECRTSLWWSKLPRTTLDNGHHGIETLCNPINISEVPFTNRFSARVPIIDMSRYLPWLVGYVSQLGVNLIAMNQYATPEFCQDGGDYSAICLCAGGWTPQMIEEEDEELFGLTGHLLAGSISHVGHAAGEVNLAHMPDGERPVYTVSTLEPNRIWMGGTAFYSTFHASGKNVAPAEDSENDRILKECEEMLQTKILPTQETRTGIRPYRKSVRLELVQKEGLEVPLCVNYGHGGAGISLAWGCAEEVLSLIEEKTGGSTMANDVVHGYAA